jgi:hypothetical protein
MLHAEIIPVSDYWHHIELPILVSKFPAAFDEMG